eukprot:CAMPEP_0119012240 /NCGR_PEP_ID=MMETSP1176-20130426/6166_1 /TAXON_ID=265551 /ORGANISM="Synedropsis recta cf, Strain CCMP1620" /LENGTH=197 /DNA_ID=CAMNT_0006965161 /DNA_START=847 /DNA_END=1441 /DNA_ORIENTATION=+
MTDSSSEAFDTRARLITVVNVALSNENGSDRSHPSKSTKNGQLSALVQSTSSTSFKTSRTKPSDNPVAAKSAIFDLTIDCPASARCVAVARVVAPHSGEMQSHPTKRFFTSNSLCNPRAESTIKPRLDAHHIPNYVETPRKATMSDSNDKFATKTHPCFLPMRPLAIARLLLMEEEESLSFPSINASAQSLATIPTP